MGGKEKFELRFNQLLCEELGKQFKLTQQTVDPEFEQKYSDTADNKKVSIKSRLVSCDKTEGLRFGEMDFGGSMMVHFGSAPPARQYDFPILGYTFLHASRFLIAVLDLHPLSRQNDYKRKYIAPLETVWEKYTWIPKAQGGRSELHEWARVYESGFGFYRWCEGKYLSNLEDAFKDYVHVFADCIEKAEPLTDSGSLAKRDAYMEKYREDYIYKDPGSGPLKHHFGEQWGERYLKEFLFGQQTGNNQHCSSF